MSLRKSLLLAAVLGAVLLYIAKVELVKDETKRAAERPLEKIAASALKEIDISTPKGSFTLVNEAPKAAPAKGEQEDTSLSAEESQQWSLKGVKDSRLDRGALNGLVSAIRAVKLENALTPEETESDLSVYGLGAPELTLSVKGVDAGGNALERRYELGKLNEYVSKRYVKDAADKTVYLTSNDLFLAVNKEPSDLRDATPVKLDTTVLRTLTVRSGAGAATSLEQIDGVWRISNPGPYSASQDSVDGMIRELRNLKVTRFVDDAEGKLDQYGLDAPILTVETALKEGSSGSPLSLSFGRVDEPVQGNESKERNLRFYMSIKGQSPIFEIGIDPVARIAKPVNALRERRLMKFDTESVSEVRLTMPDREELVLKRTGESWTVNSKPADAPFVSEFISSLAAVEAKDFPEQGATTAPQGGSATIAVTLSAVMAEGKVASEGKAASDQAAPKVLRVGPEVKAPTAGYLAIVEGSNEPFIISAESFRKLTPREEALLKSESTPESPAAAASGPDTTTAASP